MRQGFVIRTGTERVYRAQHRAAATCDDRIVAVIPRDVEASLLAMGAHNSACLPSDFVCHVLTVSAAMGSIVISHALGPRPARPRCLRGLTRTETPSAAGAVVRPPTSRLVQLRLNRRGRQGGLGNAKLAPMPLRRRAPSQIRQPGRRCGFLMATRMSR